MNENSRFNLVFAKLREALRESPGESGKVTVRRLEASPEELDEIENLRRIVLEVSEPEPMSYTTT
jgi:hypothetical protein